MTIKDLKRLLIKEISTKKLKGNIYRKKGEGEIIHAFDLFISEDEACNPLNGLMKNYFFLNRSRSCPSSKWYNPRIAVPSS